VYEPKGRHNQSIQTYFSALLVLSFVANIVFVAFVTLCCFEEKSIWTNLTRHGFIPFHVSHQISVRTMCLYVKGEVVDCCLMLILGTRDAGAGALDAHEAARDDNMALVDCLEHVSCAKVSSLVIIIVCIYVFLLGATLGKISEYAASRACYGAGRG
jgi:hypothetical protein